MSTIITARPESKSTIALAERPYVLLSVAASIDGYIDDNHADRLILSNELDFHHVRRLRSTFDAILVGAETIRRDNPTLRSVDGLPNPRRVILTGSGDLDPGLKIFADDAGDEPPLVLCSDRHSHGLRERLDDRAEVHWIPSYCNISVAVRKLWKLGVRSLMVEGGSSIHTQFLLHGLADEMRLAIAPLFVGDGEAPFLVGTGPFPHNKDHRMQVHSVEQLGDMAILHYKLGPNIAARNDDKN